MEFKKGDRVKQEGFVDTVHSDRCGDTYPVKVLWDNAGLSQHYTLCGKFYSKDIEPSLTLISRPEPKKYQVLYRRVSDNGLSVSASKYESLESFDGHTWVTRCKGLKLLTPEILGE